MNEKRIKSISDGHQANNMSRQRSQQTNTGNISASLRKPVNRRPYTSQQESSCYEDDIGQSVKKVKKEFNSNSDVLEEGSSIAQSQLLNSAKPAECPLKPVSAQTPFATFSYNTPVSHAVPNKQRCILIVSNHQQSVMTSLSSLWKAGKLCDAIISNGTENVKIHKMVLSAVCPKMLNIFDSVPQNNLPKVTFPTTSKEALMAFTEYLYNGILDLDAKILEQLKTIAQCLDMNDFERLCDDQLRIASINDVNSKLGLAPVDVKQEVCSNTGDLNEDVGSVEEHSTNAEENKIQIKIEQDDPEEQNYANEAFHFGANNDTFSQDFSSHDRSFSLGPTSDIQQNAPSSCLALNFSSKQSSTPLPTSIYQNVYEPVTRPVGYITPTSEQKLITKEMVNMISTIPHSNLSVNDNNSPLKLQELPVITVKKEYNT